MVRLPILTELRVTDYELFPGDPPGSGIAWSFQQGVTVIAGINGLGKTTLLLMILRSLAGRYDLTENGEWRSLSVVLPRKPVRLKMPHLRVFGRRVSDRAVNARVALSANIGTTAITISRRLDNLSLENLTIDEQPVELSGTADEKEAVFQSRLTELIGLGSFVDVLLVLHHVMLFYENRPGALWDANAQRHLLRPLQHRRDVVPRLRVDPDLLDGHLPELELRSVNFSHDGNVAKIAKIVPKWVDPWEITPQEYDIWTIFATRNRRLHPVESTTCGLSAEH